MTLTALTGNGNIWLPNYSGLLSNTPALRQGVILDAVGEQAGVVFEIGHESDGKSLDKIGSRIHTVGTAGNIDARIETVDLATGDPSGTLATAGSNLSQNVSATGWNEWSLTTPHTVSADEKIAVILEVPSGSGADITTGELRRMSLQVGSSFPYKVDSTSGSYVKSKLVNNTQQTITISVGYSDGTWESISGSLPVTTVGSDSLTSTGTPSEAGLEFQVPVPMTISAVAAIVDSNAAAFDIHVGNGSYNPGDTGATRLATKSVDPDVLSENTAAFLYQWKLGAAVDLAKDTTYRLTFEATTTTAVLLYFIDVDSAGLLTTLPVGTTWKYIEDNGAGGWTTTATRLPFIHLGISALGDDAGGGTTSILGGGNLSGGFA